ncbi:hypothetical protein DUI87_03629 [Hirundo rustica rustica]|uniref:Uncharacterized protein n=1 Tax=Hirundo rustica rustica TaxID=333673 RepID=A0A3M0L0V2_HIRRU|nr:hypothetical protein DUI87_03629 [Hirundo rustica rustica]
MYPGDHEGQRHPGLYQECCGQQDRAVNFPLYLALFVMWKSDLASKKIESQNHEGVLRSLPLCYGPECHPLDQILQGPIQPGLEHYQEWDIHYISGKPIPKPTTLTVKNIYLTSVYICLS